MLSNIPNSRKLLVGFGSLIILLTCLGCVSEAKKGTIANAFQILANVQDINAMFYDARIAAAAHAETGEIEYSHKVNVLTQAITETCDRVLEIMVAPANRERIGVIKGYMHDFNRLDDVLKALNEELRDRRAERVVAASGVLDTLTRGHEIVFNTATASAQMVEVNDTQVEYVDRARLNSMAQIAAIERHFGLARVAAMNFETALDRADRDRYWQTLEVEVRAINEAARELENYIVSPAGRAAAALNDLMRFLADWQNASMAIGHIIRQREANSAAIERLSALVDDLLAQVRMVIFDRMSMLIDEL